MNVSFSYNTTQVLNNISIAVPHGGITGVLGPNGSGKTTLLNLLGGLLKPTAGYVRLDKKDLSTFSRSVLAKKMAFVTQETHLAFDYSVLEIALMGRYPHLGPFQIEGPTDIKIAREALKITGTRDLENRPFASLSGGEKQRVIIASALAQLLQTSTKYEFGITEGLLLLDEPTAALDLRYQLEIAATLRSLNKNQNTTIVVATHDLNLAASLCDQLILLRSGHVLKEGPTLKVLSAETVRTLYNVEADVRFDENSGYLNITPISKSPNA